MSSDNDRDKCQHCGRLLTDGAPGNTCPACLMAEAFDSIATLPSEAGPAGAAPGNSPRFGRSDPVEGSTLGVGGRYKILQRVGEGGFGTVYMAEQTAPVRRRVALKVLKPGMDTRQVVARFEAERQALAMMDHPNIARVLDGGETEHGRPFFVMELVRGTPVTEFCNRKKLGTRQRLGLFTDVCRAVQHAHQKGVIHRDLKPSNILVTVQEGAQPIPKVIDFGVAKAVETPLTDKTLFTRFEQMVGTPAYMSPEQAGSDADVSDIDTRSDIYALGVILYELLTGTTPLDAQTLQSAGYDEVRRVLREQEAPRPSARVSSLEAERRVTVAKERDTEEAGLRRQLKGDLDWIVMKAIEKDRRRRYETANALAADVERHLNDEPVTAGPPTTSYRLAKFVRRNRTGVAVALLAGLALVAGTAVASWGLVQATSAKREAEANARSAEEARIQATRSAENAHQILAFLKSEFLSQANPGINPDPELKLRDAVARAAASLDQTEFDSPAVEAEIRRSLADGFVVLGRNRDAVPQYRKATGLLEGALGPYAEETAATKRRLARALSATAGYAEASGIQRELVAHWESLHGPDHEITLEGKYDLGVYMRGEGRHLASAELWKEIYPVAIASLGEQHTTTLRTLTRIADFYHGKAKDHAAANEWRGKIDATSLFQAGTLDATRTINSLRQAGFGVGGANNDLLDELSIRLAKEKGPQHPETLLVRLEYLAGLSSDNEVRSAEAAALEFPGLIQQLKRTLGKTHPSVARAAGQFINAEFILGRREEAYQFAAEEIKLLQGSEPSNEAEDFIQTFYFGLLGYFNRWRDIGSHYLTQLPHGRADAIHHGAMAAVGADDLASFLTFKNRAIELFGAVDDPYHSGWIADLVLAGTLISGADIDGLVAEAEPYVDRCLAGAPVRGKSQVLAMRLALLRGRNEEALEIAEQWQEEDSIHLSDIFDSAWFCVGRALALQRIGRQEEAEAFLEEVLERFDTWHDTTRLRWWGYWAAQARAFDDAQEEVMGSRPDTPRTDPRVFFISAPIYRLLACFRTARAGLWSHAFEIAKRIDPDFSREDPPIDWLVYGSVLLKNDADALYEPFRNALVRNLTADGDVTPRPDAVLLYFALPCDRAEEATEIAAEMARELTPDPGSGDSPEFFGAARALAACRLGQATRVPEILAEFEPVLGWDGALTRIVSALAATETSSPTAAWERFVEASLIPVDGSYESEYFHYALIAEALLAETRSQLSDEEVALVPPTAEWRFFAPVDGVDPGESSPGFFPGFAALGFDDTGWGSGRDSGGRGGGFGYGDPVGVKWDTPAEGNRQSAYLRHRFRTGEPFDRLVLEGQFDDGVIVYLDGEEVGRNNMPEGEPDRAGLASTAFIHELMETWPRVIPLRGRLEPGDHVLALSIHNHGTKSSDLRAAGITLTGSPAGEPGSVAVND